MTVLIYMLSALCAAVSVNAAPPVSPRLYAHPHLQQINPLDYYLDNPEVIGYYTHSQQKQENVNSASNAAPARLETLDPDSEVELLPGAQQPQQPPQQTPVSPNLPGLAPGQRVFIVHMPVPGLRPGTIGGYQPVYIVAAAPQGNPGFPANGYQNGVLLDPTGQAVISPVLGYPRPLIPGAPGTNPGLLLSTAPLTLSKPVEVAYQDPAVSYQGAVAPGSQNGDNSRGNLRLAQLVALQGQAVHPASHSRNTESSSNQESKRTDVSDGTDSKESSDEPRRNARPTPSHASRTKA